jgi:hypothetical protein
MLALTDVQAASQAQTGATQATTTTMSPGTTNQVPIALINILVELLETKIG